MVKHPSGIFVTYRGYLEGSSGGVQVCTREYVDVIRAAGVDLHICTFGSDRRLSTRILRRFDSSSYFRPAEPALLDAIVALAEEIKPNFVFLNQVTLTVLVTDIRRRLPKECRIVVLSHGLESTDLLHSIRLRRRLPIDRRFRPTPAITVGRTMMAEKATRADVDLVCALSPLDAEREKQVGAQRVVWLPRIVKPAPLVWRPTGNRLGFVGTLDHAPNLEGLVQILDRLSTRDDLKHARIRIVGRPAATGGWLARRCSQVDFLGLLEDAALAEEAATWNAFLHPIFCQARGCSTKLALAITWQLPIVTTTDGHRGYVWRHGSLVVANDPIGFVNECARLLDSGEAVAARERVTEVAHTSPTLEENAKRLRTWLEQI
jgi:hypothetical protein